jgi:hypothetical protein
MGKNSLLEDIFEISAKSPAAGLILSIIFGCVGLYLNHKRTLSLHGRTGSGLTIDI